MGMGFAMANQIGQAMAAGQSPAQNPAPPPLPAQGSCSYFVGKDGKKAGPFEKDTIIAYIKSGSIAKDTLLWREGLDSWQAVELFTEFAELIKKTPPPLFE